MCPFLKCFGFGTRKILVLYKELGSVSSKCLVEITNEVILAWSFLCGKALIMNPISLILCRTSQCFYYFWSLFANFVPFGEFAISSKLLKLLPQRCSLYFVSILGSVMMFPHFFLVLIICVFSFVPISLARGLSILLKIFQGSRVRSIDSSCLLIFCYTDFCF